MKRKVPLGVRKLTDQIENKIRRVYHFPPFRDSDKICRDFGISHNLLLKIVGLAGNDRLQVIRARKNRKKKKNAKSNRLYSGLVPASRQ